MTAHEVIEWCLALLFVAGTLVGMMLAASLAIHFWKHRND